MKSIRFGLGNVVVFAAMLLVVTGCQQPGPDMSEMSMMDIPHPAELDKLDMFVGKWAGEAVLKIPGLDEAMDSTSVGETVWTLDKRFVVEHSTIDMGEGGTLEMDGYWTWDARAKKYRSWWFGSDGSTGEATASYNDKTRTWHMKAKTTDPMTGKPGVGEGTMTFVDDNTVDWTWTEWTAWKLHKKMALSGTNRRK